MKPLRIVLIITLFLPSLLLTGCVGKNQNANNPRSSNPAASNVEKPNATKTNVEELRMLLNIPYDAEQSDWQEDVSHKKLTAVLRFSAADCDKIVADALRFRAPENVTIQSESWFPDELIAQGELSGDNTLKGTSYGANAFYQDAFNGGRLIRVEGTSYFVLEASAK